MKTISAQSQLTAIFIAVVIAIVFRTYAGQAATTVFFNSSQTTNLVASGTTSDTISSEGYLFTFTRDKLFTGGIGLTNPIGRAERVRWPQGLEAQAVTTGPVLSKARMDIKRQDGDLFAIESFEMQLLGNTGGAGAAIEVMPMLNGEDGRPDPYMYDATGYYGQHFTYNTPELKGFDAYKINLYVDWALIRLTVVDARPVLGIAPVAEGLFEISWSTNALGYRLEYATNLPTQAWNLVTNEVATIGDLFAVEIENKGSKQFYRLKK